MSDRGLPRRAPPYGPAWRFWLGVVLGLTMIGIGVRGLLVNANRTHPPDWALWFIGSDLVHDALFAPAIVVAGYAIAKLVPVSVRRHVQAALFVSGTLALVGFPLVRGYGVRPHNPSHLPRNYLGGLVALLAAVWLVALVWMLASVARERSAQRRSGELEHPVLEADAGAEAEL